MPKTIRFVFRLSFNSFSSFKSDKTPSTNSTNPATDDQEGMSTVEQFDKLVKIANEKGSDWFKGLSAGDLIKSRSAFMAHITKKEANTLIGLVGTPLDDFKASDSITIDYLVKKWRKNIQGQGASTTPSAPSPTNLPNTSESAHIPNSTTTSSTTVKYNPTTDVDYDKKVSILSKWYDYVKAENKKRVIPRYVPSKNDFTARFLPWAVSDLMVYTALVYKTDKGRDVKDNNIMKSLKKKYPASFKGNDTIYSFSGAPVMLSNKTNWNF